MVELYCFLDFSYIDYFVVVVDDDCRICWLIKRYLELKLVEDCSCRVVISMV